MPNNKAGKLRKRAKWPIRPKLIPVSGAWRDYEYFYSLVDGMLVRCRFTPSIKFAGIHLHTWVERGTVRVNCLVKEHNVMSPVRTRTQTARSWDARTNHDATAPPTMPNNITPLLLNCTGRETSRVHRRSKTADGRTKRRQKLTDCADIWEEVGEKWKSQDKVLKVLKKFNVRY